MVIGEDIHAMLLVEKRFQEFTPKPIADARLSTEAIVALSFDLREEVDRLVKTAFAGGDPNWGRIMMATGRSGVELDQSRLALWIGLAGEPPLQLVRDGTPTGYAEAEAAAIFARPEFTVHVDLGNGAAEALMWTTDLTHDYVTINADYRT